MCTYKTHYGYRGELYFTFKYHNTVPLEEKAFYIVYSNWTTFYIFNDYCTVEKCVDPVLFFLMPNSVRSSYFEETVRNVFPLRAHNSRLSPSRISKQRKNAYLKTFSLCDDLAHLGMFHPYRAEPPFTKTFGYNKL